MFPNIVYHDTQARQKPVHLDGVANIHQYNMKKKNLDGVAGAQRVELHCRGLHVRMRLHTQAWMNTGSRSTTYT